MSHNFHWTNIISLDSSQNNAFEELVCQLAKKENIPNKKEYIKVGNPDGGIECYIILENGDEVGFQAKWFLSTPQDTQWNQVGKSFKTALEKHPNLTHYYIAIPLDRADPRIENQQWFMDKWNTKVREWNNHAQTNYGKTVYFEYWGGSELISRLSKEDNSGLKKFFFGELNLSKEWFKRQNELAIKDLGPRYTPEINVELNIVENFDGISRNERFKDRLGERYHLLMVSYREFVSHKYFDNNEIDSLLEQLDIKVRLFEKLYEQIDFLGNKYIDFDEIDKIVEEMSKISDKISELLYALNEKEIEAKKITTSHGYRTATTYDASIRKHRDCESELYQFRSVIRSRALKLVNNPFMILDGEAGIGKSHLLADIVNERLKEDFYSIFLLGQHFREDKAPWSQILDDLLRIKCNEEDFLGALNSKAEAQGKRIIIFIDAINEGKGRSFWNAFLVGFIESIKRYEWLGLILSIRSSYSNLIIPESVFQEHQTIPITHFGFDGVEYDASKLFFSHYNIEQPAIPLLHPEFSNPLFLKLFCEGLNNKGLTKIPDGHEGITSIINFFKDGIEEKLNFKYPNLRKLDILSQIINTYIEKMDDSQTLDYKEAYLITEDVTSKYRLTPGLLDDLISEGFFTQNMFYNGEEYTEGIYFAYERFEDHFRTEYLLTKYINTKDIKASFQKHELKKYFENRWQFRGIIDAMSIQLPEKHGVELIDVVSQDKIVIDSFLESLIWRKAESITPKLIKRVTKNLQNKHIQKEVFEALFMVATNPKHPLNALYLHEYLLSFNMRDRDVWFLTLLNDIYLNYSINPIKRLIDWAWSDENKNYLSDESVLLTSITLSWFLSSSNRVLRDYSTKAMVSILQNRPHVVLNLLKQFENINDPYVYERLFAVGFGVVVRSDNKNGLKELGEYIYKIVFDVDDVYPHILLRDYAKNTIEYIDYLGIALDIYLYKVKPPYKSYLPPIEELPAEDDIEKFQDRDKNYHQSRIISSMLTEYGWGKGGYGDFGRYVFGSTLHDFECKKDEQRLSAYATKKIFEEYGYHGEFFNEAEKAIQEHNRHDYDRHNHKIERIGKKYQWIAMYDTLARVTDNFKMYEGYGDNKQEVKYQGAFEPYARDIDSTILLKKTRVGTNVCQNNWCKSEFGIEWAMDSDDWVQIIDDLPNPFDIINLVDDQGEEWISLHSSPVWKEPIKKGYDHSSVIQKELWYILNAYLIPNNELDEFVQWAEKQRFWNNWMPGGKGHYQMFNREHYWSDAYRFLQDPYYGYEDWSHINPYQGTNYPHKVGLTYNSYYWEEEFDYSKEESLGFLKPSKILFDGLRMQYSSKEGEFVNNNNKLVCFDAKMKYSSFESLLFNKKMLFHYLQENNLSLCWTIIGEKQIFVPMNNNDDKTGLMQMNGYCFMKEHMERGGKMNVMSMNKNGNKTYKDVNLG